MARTKSKPKPRTMIVQRPGLKALSKRTAKGIDTSVLRSFRKMGYEFEDYQGKLIGGFLTKAEAVKEARMLRKRNKPVVIEKTLGGNLWMVWTMEKR